jgi:hypothetical protein
MLLSLLLLSVKMAVSPMASRAEERLHRTVLVTGPRSLDEGGTFNVVILSESDSNDSKTTTVQIPKEWQSMTV